MTAIEVRAIRDADASAYIELLQQLDRESTFLLWEPGERTITAEALRAHMESVDRTQRLHLLATCDDYLVGFLVCIRGAVRRLRHRCDFTMAVTSEHQHKGIGTGLLRAMEEWAIANNVRRIELTVMSHNLAAIALYERAGFVLEGVKRGAIRVDDAPVDECVMGKALDG
jgi:RimJ/RimL family protein N-acetyltransferase